MVRGGVLREAQTPIRRGDTHLGHRHGRAEGRCHTRARSTEPGVGRAMVVVRRGAVPGVRGGLGGSPESQQKRPLRSGSSRFFQSLLQLTTSPRATAGPTAAVFHLVQKRAELGFTPNPGTQPGGSCNPT